MLYFLSIVVNLVQLVIEFLEIVLFISAILSWIPGIDEDNIFVRMVDTIAEPVLFPARLLVDRSNFLASLPIDASYIITYVALMLIEVFLPQIVI